MRTREGDGEGVSAGTDAHRTAEAVNHLGELLRSGADLERVVDGYLETRRLLTATFKRLAQARVPASAAVMNSAREDVLQEMRRRFGPAVPEDLLHVQRYGKVHSLLLAYLLGRKGQFVSSTRLRLLAGDQVHTERRLRELRDLGYDLQAARVSGEIQYALADAKPDLAHAAAAQLRANIKSCRTLGSNRKRELLELVG